TLWEGLGRALEAMAKLEGGAIANPDENRRVGHYWLRNPDLAPDPEIGAAIRSMWAQIDEIANRVLAGTLCASDGAPFREVLLVGIGGSALGPQLLADALASPTNQGLPLRVLDNTDPAGIARTLAALSSLAHTLVLVISKSGSTVETRNGMLEIIAACNDAGLSFAQQALAITGKGSKLASRAMAESWLAIVPMWDWVGGRTSVLAAVGLLPAALQGLDWRALLGGAAAMDQRTRAPARNNPAALLALLWHHQGQGHGAKAMVALPYRDALILLSRYLQQLVMESLGKRLDRQGHEVWQGLSVYGNKGSTDQHAYVQQLRDGLNNFFALFVRVLDDGSTSALEVEPGVTSGDCLDGFYQGTRAALRERGRASATLVLGRLDASTIGATIALFERAVGLYAELIDINAYHQPGVEAGKVAAQGVLDRQRRLLAAVMSQESGRTAAEIGEQTGDPALATWQILRRLAANQRIIQEGNDPTSATFHAIGSTKP
ncbi:MAG TPA: glucose-6-phosphate isomerase, partial [Nannocystis exedens]|nr:glucose-6-phosphate isomerase [Nannocystis exedens]